MANIREVPMEYIREVIEEGKHVKRISLNLATEDVATTSGSMSIYFYTQVKPWCTGSIDTNYENRHFVGYNIYNGQNFIETVKCPYATHCKSLPPFATARSIFVGTLFGLGEEVPYLKWIVLAYSFLEVLLGFRGQVASTRGANSESSWISIMLRGIFPGVVAILSDGYSAALVLLVVSSLPYFRGTIRTTWIMTSHQMMGEVVLQFLASVITIYFIAELANMVGGNDETSLNPWEVIFSNGKMIETYGLNSVDGWKLIPSAFLILVVVRCAFFATGLMDKHRFLRLCRGNFSHRHSRSFVSWRFRKNIDLMRTCTEPALGKAEKIISFLSIIGVIILLFFFELEIVTLFATFLAYEMDIGYMAESDESAMAMWNMLYNDPLTPIQAAFDEARQFLDIPPENVANDESEVLLLSQVVDFPAYGLRSTAQDIGGFFGGFGQGRVRVDFNQDLEENGDSQNILASKLAALLI